MVTFNPGSNDRQVSRLRLINPGDAAAEVTIEGTDDKGRSPGSAVVLSLAAGASRTLTARALERGEGEGLSGALGDGSGKWRLLVTSDHPVWAMSLLSTPTGHLTNLSSGAPGGTAEEVFRDHISGPIVQAKCVLCHVEGGAATLTDLKFVRSSTPGHQALNFEAFKDFLADEEHDGEYILNKIQGGLGHGGGPQVPVDTPEFADMEWFLRLLGEDISIGSITPATLFDTVRMAPTPRVLRRAALIFAGRIPTDAELSAARGGGEALRATIRGMMEGPEFHEFLIRAANDRLLTDRERGSVGSLDVHLLDFNRDNYRRRAAAHASGTDRAWHEYHKWRERVNFGSDRAPLELIAHVVENDLPYTEVLTADYIMANPWAAEAYGASTRFDDPDDMHEFQPSEIVSYYRKGEGYEEEYDPVVDASRILSPGPLITDYPHAGVLNTTAFLRRYPTTATNRNRARSRWTYYHFLGLDIEKSASRTTDPDALADTNNPTMLNPACTVCHRVLDPVAGAFQNYFDEGQYKTNWGGIDSLDRFYKETIGPLLPIRATSWRDRETLSWPVQLAAGVETLRVFLRNHIETDEYNIHIGVHLDRIRVTDTEGVVVASQEFEDLTPPVAPWGACGEAQRNSSAGGEAYLYMWSGWLPCSISIDVEVPSDGAYNVEIVTWSNDRHERDDVFAVLAVDVNPYREGDTWYRDMRAPGFADERAPNPDNSVQWLARRIVADKRFAEATVKFWWPAIMGSEVAEPPEDEGDAGFEATAARGQRTGRGGRAARDRVPAWIPARGRHTTSRTSWSRSCSRSGFGRTRLEDKDPVRRIALGDAGARRLLTPEELARKTAALTGYLLGTAYPHQLLAPVRSAAQRADGRSIGFSTAALTRTGFTERASATSPSVMEGVAKTHALEVSCPVVLRELYLVPEGERRLFSGIDPLVTPTSEFSASFEIRAGARSRKETLSFGGPLSAGPKTVTFTYVNDYWEPPNNDRNVRLDRLVVRDAAGRTVARRELETLAPVTDCNHPLDDHFALHCQGSVEVPIDVPATGDYELEIVAWADQAGDELPRLSAVVETESGPNAGSDAIRTKLVELHDRLLGVQVTPHSPDVEAAYRLFVDVWERNREAQRDLFDRPVCPINDLFFFEGILDDAVTENGEGIDWDRVITFLDGVDWSDPHSGAQT